MNNPISALFTDITAHRREKRFQEFREWLEAYQASHAWTLLKCSMCAQPATAPDARFCAFCGASLYVSSAKLHPALEQEKHTEPMQHVPGQRFLDYVRERHQDTGPQTALHRAVHLQKEKAHHP